MRGRIWIFAVLVAAALAVHLALLSAKVAQTGEDNVRARLALATSALRGQLELLDARLSPRAVASAPDLVEATRPPADPTEPLGRPGDRALRAAASALSPEPDLLAVVNGQGAIVSRRARAAQGMDDAAPLPLAKAALEGTPASAFALFDGSVYRVAAARVPGNGAAAVVGTLVDDRFAAQLKSQVDADVTLIQGGKVLASSLPPGDARARLLRWAAAPAPGYGVLPIYLPVIGDQLSGKLPRGATRYAVRGALLSLDSGVQAALTVPAAPYLAWLGRYQAFYLAAFVLFVLFSLLWGLLARPAPVVVAPAPVLPVPESTVGPVVVRRAAPSLLGTDVGEPRSAPPPSDDVPWPATDPVEVTTKSPPPMESLDPEVPAPARPGGSGAEHPMWSADPFTPTPEALETHAEPEEVSAEEIGLVEAEPSPPPPPLGSADEDAEPAPELHAAGSPEAHAAEAHPSDEPGAKESSAARGDFSFAGLLNEAHGASPSLDETRPSLAQDHPDTTAPGQPNDDLLAKSRGESDEPAPFPGDEPTRIEPVSAALLDKLRERDEEMTAKAREPAEEAPPPQQGWGSLVPEGDGAETTSVSGPPGMDPALPPPDHVPEASVTMQDFSMPAVDAQDPDEPHWRETYDKFREMKAQLGEPADRISFAKFATKLRKNRADLLAKHNCKGVRFSVYEKDGKAAIKASAIR